MRQVSLRLAEEVVARIDAARGDVPRERWIRRAIDAGLEAASDHKGEESPDPRRQHAHPHALTPRPAQG